MIDFYSKPRYDFEDLCQLVRALRAPDGSFLPTQPLYIIVEAAPDEPQDKPFSAGEEQLMTDVSGIFAKKFAQYVQGQQ